MKCLCCPNTAVELHHVIRRGKGKGGTDNPENLAPLCRTCHDILHFSKDTNKQNEILRKCYDYIKPNLDKCWSAKKGIPAVVQRLINEIKEENEK